MGGGRLIQKRQESENEVLGPYINKGVAGSTPIFVSRMPPEC